MKYKIKVATQYQGTAKSLEKYLQKYPPAEILEEITGCQWDKDIEIEHKNLGEAANFSGYKFFFSFRQPVDYMWICVCHELAHLILREKIQWKKNNRTSEFLKLVKSYRTPVMKNNFAYAYEQTMAILLQAGCEKKIERRPLHWSAWEKTFLAMDVAELGKRLWPQFKKFFNTNIDGRGY